MRTIAVIATAAALLTAAGPAAAKGTPYKGETQGGSSITFTLSGGKVGKVSTLVPTICADSTSRSTRAGGELYQPPGRLALNRTVKTKALQRGAMTQGSEVTKNYTFTAKKRGPKISGKLKLSFSYLVPDLFQTLPHIYICSGSTGFTATPR
jgi:hypothetical protein